MLCDISFARRAGPDDGDRRQHRRGQDDARSTSSPGCSTAPTGTVLVGGVDVRDLDPDVLWSRIGLVPQKPYLFSGTVASNLRFGKPDATDDELWAALEVAQARRLRARRCPAGSTRRSSRAAPTCRAGSASAWRSPGRSSASPNLPVRRLVLGARPRHRRPAARRARARTPRDAAVVIVAQRVSTIIERRPDPRARGRRRSSASARTTSCSRLPDVRRDRRSRRSARRRRHERHRRRRPRRPTRADDEDVDLAAPRDAAAGAAGWRSAGMPAERSKDFGNVDAPPGRACCGPSGCVLVARRRRWRSPASRSIVLGPKVLGHATNIIVARRRHAARASTSARCTACCSSRSCAVRRRRRSCRTSQSYMLAGVVQRSMFRLRADVEDKLNRLPLSYVDKPAARRPAQPGHQRHRQRRAEPAADAEPDAHVDAARSSACSIMMFTISPLLALVALITIPISLFGDASSIAKRSAAAVHRAVAPHRHAQRADRGGVHRPRAREGVRPPARGRGSASATRTTSSTRRASARSSSRASIQPAMMFLGNLNYVAIAVVGGLRVASGAMTHRRHPGVHPVLAPVHAAAHAAGVDDERVPVGHRLGSSGSSSSSTPTSRAPDPPTPLDRPPSRAAGSSSTHVSFSYDPTTAAHRGPVARRRARADRRHRRPDRRGQDHARQPDHAVLRARRRRASRSTAATSPTMRRARAAVEHRHGAAGHVAVRRHDPRQHRLRQPRRHRGADPRGGAGHLRRPLRALAARRLRHAHRRRGRQRQRRARSSCSRSPARSSPTPRSSSSTRPPARSTPAPRCSSRRRWPRCARNRTSFVIAHRLSTIRDADMILVMEHGAASSSRARTTSCSAADGAYCTPLQRAVRRRRPSTSSDPTFAHSPAQYTTAQWSKHFAKVSGRLRDGLRPRSARGTCARPLGRRCEGCRGH